MSFRRPPKEITESPLSASRVSLEKVLKVGAARMSTQRMKGVDMADVGAYDREQRMFTLDAHEMSTRMNSFLAIESKNEVSLTFYGVDMLEDPKKKYLKQTIEEKYHYNDHSEKAIIELENATFNGGNMFRFAMNIPAIAYGFSNYGVDGGYYQENIHNPVYELAFFELTITNRDSTPRNRFLALYGSWNNNGSPILRYSFWTSDRSKPSNVIGTSTCNFQIHTIEINFGQLVQWKKLDPNK